MNIQRLFFCFYNPFSGPFNGRRVIGNFISLTSFYYIYNTNITSVWLIDWSWCTQVIAVIYHSESMATMRDAFNLRHLIITVISSVLIFQYSTVDSFPLPDAPFVESPSTFSKLSHPVFTCLFVFLSVTCRQGLRVNLFERKRHFTKINYQNK